MIGIILADTAIEGLDARYSTADRSAHAGGQNRGPHRMSGRHSLPIITRAAGSPADQLVFLLRSTNERPTERPEARQPF